MKQDRRKTARPETNQITDASNDRAYFIVTPRIVWAFSRTPYDLTLWQVVKDIAGEQGYCTLDTPQLAKLSMMSAGQVADSREYLLAVGLLLGKLYREQHYRNPVWHLTVPDLWRPNIEWSQQFKSLKARLLFKEQQKEAVKKVWERYKAIKANRKANGQWEYDQEQEFFEVGDLQSLGLNYALKQTDSPGESVVKQSVTDSPGESTGTPGESTGTWSEPTGTPGETKKIIKKNDDQYEWMNDDPIARFLCAMPGYNRRGIEADRRKIISGKYDIDELAYLWADAQDKSTSNPIGLFLMMCDSGQHSSAYIEAKADQRDRAEQGADAQDAVTRFEKSTAPERLVVQHPDWDAVLQELRSMWNGQFKSINPRLVAIDEQPNTFTVLVNRSTPHMAGDFERMLRGIAPKRQWTVKLVTE